MTRSLHLRTLTADDLDFADSLRALAGWNQTIDDWRRFLSMQPDGCFFAEWEGTPVGTATTLVYGSELAWIGMVLVHPEHRRRGIGRALLTHCIEWLQERRVRCIKLDATPAGREVYVRLGFKDEWTLTRWEHSQIAVARSSNPRLRQWTASDADLVAATDSAAFGLARHELLWALTPQAKRALALESAPGQLSGYGMLRAGARALYLGPVVASSSDDGLELLSALLSDNPRPRVFWDIPDDNTAAVGWARDEGFQPQRSLTRMYLGNNFAPGNPQRQFALAGPEVG